MLPVTKIVLEQLTFGSQYSIDHKYFNKTNTKIETYLGDYHAAQVVRFHHYVYGGRPQKETHEVKYPAGWWNAFKEAYPRLCRWFKPVQYVTVKVEWEGRLLFPEIALSKYGKYTSVAVWSDKKVK